MRKLTYIVCMAFMLLCTRTVYADRTNEEDIFVLEYTDGSTLKFTFSQHPSLFFVDGYISLKLDETEMVVHELENLEGFHFETGTVGIKQVAMDPNEIVIEYDSYGTMRVNGCAAKDRIRIYDLAGRMIDNMSVGENGTAIVSLAQLPHGTYILMIANKRSVKIKR